MKLSEMFKDKVFITDLGEYDICEDEKSSVGRYAVWSPLNGADGHRIVEVSDDLEEIKKKYNVSNDCVCYLKQNGGI